MTRKIALVEILLVGLTLIGFANLAVAQNADKSGDKTVTDLIVMSDGQFYEYIVDKLISTGDDDLKKVILDLYEKTDDSEIRINILGEIDKLLGNEELKARVYEILIRAVSEGLQNINISDPFQAANAWKVRVMAATIIGKVAKNFTDPAYPKDRLMYALLWAVQYDDDERVRGTAALSLGKLISEQDGHNKIVKSEETLQEKKKNGKFFVERMVTAFEKVPLKYQFQAACLAKALGLTENPMAIIPLPCGRNRGFNEVVQRQIIVALAKIAKDNYEK